MDLKGALVKLSPLMQLLEDINYQRTKEMRNLMKDDSGFVVLQGNTQWTEIFVRHFLFQNHQKAAIDSDDLLFFVRKKYIKESSRSKPKYEDEIEVFRKDSKKLPIGDPDVDWEETVYLNCVIHQFDYYLTLAICTRTSPKELQILKRHSQRVYASPSRRKMDSKGESEEITYPHICFMVDNFDEVFSDILVRDGEMVCVELVAKDHDGSIQGVIFLGSIRYDALKKVYDARQSSLSSKMAQRMTFGLFNSAPQTRCEFVRMKGPGNKGFAEMAVTKPKGSGIETPTSEPGFCMTDMFDSECEDDLDECYNQKHQRRLSDPSANLNNFSKNGWRTTKSSNNQAGYGNSKVLSQNEGLDSLANEVWEIEAGDVRDVECVMGGYGRNKDGENAVLMNHADRYPTGSIQSTNVLAVFKTDPSQKDYNFEMLLTEAAKFLCIDANLASDSAMLITGTLSGIGIVYAIQHLPFYKMAMLRWPFTLSP
ncbi:unnamed protein product [Chironomus riparius]|uniref:Uncharacterized protein n=1 Tax=Chironomus riparius TaxID=315576 RepID=A0A9N9RLT9_9DIPT|nr:unnamed protein product [Chironomus riparius]